MTVVKGEFKLHVIFEERAPQDGVVYRTVRDYKFFNYDEMIGFEKGLIVASNENMKVHSMRRVK